MSKIDKLLETLNNTFLELENTRAWMEDRGHKLDPKLEADRYRDIAQQIHLELATINDNPNGTRRSGAW